MSELKLLPFQEEVVNDNESEIIIANFSRQLGKTFTLAMKVMKNKPNSVLFIGANTGGSFRIFSDKIQELCKSNEGIRHVALLFNKIIIEFSSGEITTILNDCEVNRGRKEYGNLDLILYSDVLPFVNKYKAKQHISTVSMNQRSLAGTISKGIKVVCAGLGDMKILGWYDEEHLKKTKEKYPDIFINEIDILNEYNLLFNNEKEVKYDSSWIDIEINKLMQEFSNVPQSDRTTMTREKILGMILELKKLQGGV